ncbi:MAG: hypothetical protein R2802_08530 [Flavobacteriaceae bacterium]|nr:hypothetical protein [Mangrovimonas sp.]MCB0425803.1 hypothetical protein [Mangrovimonas sp.]MCB0432656.1 hypothetical protein [Mangrovimonas sp.]MCB0436360.1 hypothetical protein [Mangrovimonas sp.]MCB0437868.1 hypothetical protein [Mangrovimonas sp.]
MKQLFVGLCALLVLVSCSINDDSPQLYYEFMPVDSVDIPEEFQLNHIYEITMTYTRPDDCYAYSDVYYANDGGNTRTVAVICTVYQDDNCLPLDYPEYEVSFNFKPTSLGTYVFNFWQGEDENGEDQFMVIEVPVTE